MCSYLLKHLNWIIERSETEPVTVTTEEFGDIGEFDSFLFLNTFSFHFFCTIWRSNESPLFTFLSSPSSRSASVYHFNFCIHYSIYIIIYSSFHITIIIYSSIIFWSHFDFIYCIIHVMLFQLMSNRSHFMTILMSHWDKHFMIASGSLQSFKMELHASNCILPPDLISRIRQRSENRARVKLSALFSQHMLEWSTFSIFITRAQIQISHYLQHFNFRLSTFPT